MATEPSTSESTTAAASPQPELGAGATSSAPGPPPAAASTATAAAAPAAAPHPLDGLSPTDLRIKLDHARKDLRQHLDKKRKLDRELAQLEQSIYAFEGSYLSDALFPAANTSGNQAAGGGAAAAQFGNIIRGYDSYLKAPSASAQDRKRFRPGDPPSDKERMFSASSATFHKSVELRAAETAASMSVEPESDDDYSTSSRRKQRGRH